MLLISPQTSPLIRSSYAACIYVVPPLGEGVTNRSQLCRREEEASVAQTFSSTWFRALFYARTRWTLLNRLFRLVAHRRLWKRPPLWRCFRNGLENSPDLMNVSWPEPLWLGSPFSSSPVGGLRRNEAGRAEFPNVFLVGRHLGFAVGVK